MSFSATVKDELSRDISRARHCQLAELSGILCFSGKLVFFEDHYQIVLGTEHVALARKYYGLIKKVFKLQPTVNVSRNKYLNRSRVYSVIVEETYHDQDILKALKLTDALTNPGQVRVVNELLLQKSCCKRAYIRGAFLSAGSMTDPEKGYHLEIVTDGIDQAEQLIKELAFFDIEAKYIERKGHMVVYLKEGSQIVDTLNVMEAHSALMELENVRILKEVRNDVNRRVNCETANLNKTVNAAVRQIQDIEKIRDTIGLEDLPPALKDMAEARLGNPDANLKELGQMLTPPVGKSGVNHRLKKLSAIAEELS